MEISAQRDFFNALSSSVKEMHEYPGFYHASFHEKDRQAPIRKAREFIVKSFESDADHVTLLDADKKGFSKREYDALKGPAAPHKAPAFAVQRVALKTLGRLSKGINIGWTAGFNSGESLDHVYENRAQGITFVGRMFDRSYLNAIGWVGIRQRKVHLKELLKTAAQSVATSRKPVRIMDVASGPGRYLFEAVREIAAPDVSLMLRDYNERNLDLARAHAERTGVKNVVLARGDAFDAASLSQVRPRPNIVVVSGLYELFSENHKVMNSLRGIEQVMEDGGYLIYTCQPWHPQVEMIARTLVNREGVPWIMRRRSKAEMDELVGAVGFCKMRTLVDRYGIFTVSLAQKRRRNE